LLAGLLVAAPGCSGEVVNLGSSPLEAGGSTASGGAVSRSWVVDPSPVLPQVEDLLLANPTLNLSAEPSELYYSAQDRYSDPPLVRIEMATRGAAGFGVGMKIPFGDPDTFDASSPAVSAAGDELWFSQLGAKGHTEIWRSARDGAAWATPTLVTELSSSLGDSAARPPAVNGTIMPLSSKRHRGPYYQIYFSERSAPGAAWSEPHQTGLTAINSPDFQSADGFLSESGLDLYFSSTRDGDHNDSDLYVAHRGSIGAEFGAPQPLVDLNDPVLGLRSHERMPWLSPAGDALYFVSDRSGQYTLYVATKL